MCLLGLEGRECFVLALLSVAMHVKFQDSPRTQRQKGFPVTPGPCDVAARFVDQPVSSPNTGARWPLLGPIWVQNDRGMSGLTPAPRVWLDIHCFGMTTTHSLIVARSVAPRVPNSLSFDVTVGSTDLAKQASSLWDRQPTCFNLVHVPFCQGNLL